MDFLLVGLLWAREFSMMLREPSLWLLLRRVVLRCLLGCWERPLRLSEDSAWRRVVDFLLIGLLWAREFSMRLREAPLWLLRLECRGVIACSLLGFD